MKAKTKVQIIWEGISILLLIIVTIWALTNCNPAMAQEDIEVSCDDTGYPFVLLAAEAKLRGDKKFAVFNAEETKILTKFYNIYRRAHSPKKIEPELVGIFAHTEINSDTIISKSLLLIFVEDGCIVEYEVVDAKLLHDLLNGRIFRL